MRVGLIALLQESNTFSPQRTSLDDFREDLLLTGDQIHDELADAHHEVGGFFAGLDEAGLKAVPIFAARAVPSGTMSNHVLERLESLLLEQLHRAGPLDGVLVAPHGATVSEAAPDADGHWLALVRNFAGADTPICGTFDLHANLSPTMVDATDALVAYRTNPHLDQRQRGKDAALILGKALKSQIQLTQSACFLPLAIGIESQLTADPPCAEVFAIAEEMLGAPGVLSTSIALGFPYADVSDMGASTVVVTDGDRGLAQRLAVELAEALWERREQFNRPAVPLETAMERTLAAEGPVCLLDIGDNIGGGGPGDATYLARALMDGRVERSLVCLCDPEAVSIARQAGPGNSISCEVGGKSCPEAGRPIQGRFVVRGLSTGRFTENQARHGGFSSFDQGSTAVLEHEKGLTVVATSKRVPPFSLSQLTSVGIQPERFHAIAVKGVHAPVAAYQEVCREFLRVDTPGVTTADMTKLNYRNRRRPLYPFERDCQWSPAGRTA